MAFPGLFLGALVVIFLARGPALAQTATPAAAAPSAGAFAITPERPRLLWNAADLAMLRVRARGGSETWRDLARWALSPARQGALAAEGPGLALAAALLGEDSPKTAARLGALAVKCALGAGRYGQVGGIRDGAIQVNSPALNKVELQEGHYNLVAPAGLPGQARKIARLTPTRIFPEGDPATLERDFPAGSNFLLLQDSWREASSQVEALALTLDWAWSFFSPAERQLLAAWLTGQAHVFPAPGAGAFDSRAAALLKIYGLAGLAAAGVAPGAAEAANLAWEDLFLAQMAPALENAGAGGAWFEGSSLGARAGLDLALFAAAMKTAAGQDAVARARWFQDRLTYLVYHLGPWPGASPRGPYFTLAPLGDQVLPPWEASDLVRLQMEAFCWLRPADPTAPAAGAFLLEEDRPRLLEGRWLPLEMLWLDPLAPAAALASQPLHYVAPALGQAFSRSDWTPWGTWLVFNAGPHYAEPTHLAALDLEIDRQGPLLARGGGYDGPATPHAQNYAIRTVAHNSLLILDPKEYSWFNLRAGDKARGAYANDGGQRAWALFGPEGRLQISAPWTASGWDNGDAPWTKLKEVYQAASLTGESHMPRFSYFRGEATAAYQGSTHKAEKVIRHVVHMRPGGTDDAEAVEVVAVLDEVVLADPGLELHQVFHFPAPPQAPAGFKSLGPGRTTGKSRWLKAENGPSRLFVVSLEEKEPQMLILGGENQADSWVDGKNWPPSPPAVNQAPWRAEIICPPQAGNHRIMVTCLLPAAADDPPPPSLRRLTSPDPGVVGLLVGDNRWPRVVVLRTGEPDARAAITYRYAGAASRHLVCGLPPQTSYQVKVAGVVVTLAPGPGLVSSDGGVLAFRLDPRAHQAAQLPETKGGDHEATGRVASPQGGAPATSLAPAQGPAGGRKK
ncbi:MAG: hypothetical protein KQJ78_13350 [Deltaproteobacteria bacterium]|nr:hypothetical protein [Deltaproteobacteria bacterium]